MSDDPPRYAIYCSSERSARTLQFAIDAAIGIPRPGTRIGTGHHGGRNYAGTLTHAGISEHPDGGWLYDVFRGNDGVAFAKPLVIVERQAATRVPGEAEKPPRLTNLANRERPATGLRPTSNNAAWPLVMGFFREYLADLLPSVEFDIVEIRASQRDTGTWHCDVRGGAYAETYDISAPEVFDLLLGVETDDSFVTWRIAIEEFAATNLHLMYLRLPRETWERYPRMRMHGRDDMIGVFDGLAGAYIFTLLAYIAIEGGVSGSAPLDYNEFNSNRWRTNAARSLVSASLAVYCTAPRAFHVFDQLQLLAEQRYEGRAAVGSIMFCSHDHDAWIDWSAKLEQPVPLTETKRVRKLLEASAGAAHLISDSNHVFGLGRPSAEDLTRYFARYHGDGRWTFTDASHTALLEAAGGKVQIPAAKLGYGQVRRHLERHLPGILESSSQALFSVVTGAVLQRHGTTIVVASDPNEADRLVAGSFKISPRRLTAEDTVSLTSMDGALLFDSTGQCAAIAVILDGAADGVKGESGRGARYNSALRYIEGQRRAGKNCVAIVISEDGGIDLLPNE